MSDEQARQQTAAELAKDDAQAEALLAQLRQPTAPQSPIDRAVEKTAAELELERQVQQQNPPAEAKPLTLRQQKEQELASLNQQFAQAKLTKQEALEEAKAQDSIMTSALTLINYIRKDLERLPPDPEPPKQEG